MQTFVLRASGALAAAAILASALPAERATAAVITYGYSGTVTTSSTGPYAYLVGQPLTATFTVDTDVP